MTAWQELKKRVLTTSAVRRVDRLAVESFHMNSLVLMENAALGCVQWVQMRFDRAQKTVILCGNGNNGGDGLVLARHLQVLGWPCVVMVLGPKEKLSPDARVNFEILMAENGRNIELRENLNPDDELQILSAELIVDAMLGTGAKGAPRAPLLGWVAAANQAKAFRVAIDVPTGIDAEAGGQAWESFRPDATLTFVARKPAMVRPDSPSLFGEIEVLPIGIPDALICKILADSESS